MASKYEYMIGKDVGSVHIIGIKNNGKRYYFETTCNICGKYKLIRISELIIGKQTRCSCQRKNIKTMNIKKGYTAYIGICVIDAII